MSRRSDRVITGADVLIVLDALAVAREDRAWLCRATRCPRCRAPVGAPCVKPDGGPLLHRAPHDGTTERWHAPRVDAMCHAVNWAALDLHREDLVIYGDRPSTVLDRLRKTKLYQLALRDRRLVSEVSR